MYSWNLSFHRRPLRHRKLIFRDISLFSVSSGNGGVGGLSCCGTPFPFKLHLFFRFVGDIVNRYVVFALSVMSLMGTIVVFSDYGGDSGSLCGIVHDIEESSKGFTFTIDVSSGSIRCFSYDPLDDLGLYRIYGSFSDGGSMFFVTRVVSLDDSV